MSWGIYLFGSHARNDHTPQSDKDILLVDKEGGFFKENIYEVPFSEVSRYSYGHLKDLYQRGNLFAWHLYFESKFLEGTDLLATFGMPGAYSLFTQNVV